MAPFVTSAAGKLIFGLITGFILGFTIQKAKVVRYEVLVGQLRLKDLTMLKLMLTAVVVGMVGIYIFKDIGIVGLSIKSTQLVANILGGLIFGVGFALLGYCPGTGVGAVGEGRTDAFWAEYSGCWWVQVSTPRSTTILKGISSHGAPTARSLFPQSCALVSPIIGS